MVAPRNHTFQIAETGTTHCSSGSDSKRVFAPQRHDVVRIVALGDTPGEQRQPESPDLVAVEVAHGIPELLRRRVGLRREAVPGERVENPGIVSVGWLHFVALFRRVSASMRDTHSAQLP